MIRNGKDVRKIKGKISSKKLMDIIEENPDRIEIANSVVESSKSLKRIVRLIELSHNKDLPEIVKVKRGRNNEIV